MSGANEIISKRLSYVLRHAPESIGIELDSNGWVEVSLLLAALASTGEAVSLTELEDAVSNNDKKRFSFDETGKRIRANQGHSIAVDLNYQEKEPPTKLFHGTASRFLASIKQQGLIKGSRHHVHLTESKDTAISVGSRYGKPVLLEIDALAMWRDGAKFFLSDNNVWLTDAVPWSYISEQSDT